MHGNCIRNGKIYWSDMAIEGYRVSLRVKLEPIWHQDPPKILLGVDSTNPVVLDQPRWFDFDFVSPGRAHTLTIEMTNKHDRDTIPALGLDKAVIIKHIEFFGISDPRFIWVGQYSPCYPEPWFSQQSPQPDLVLSGQDRLSWNGPWILEFQAPVFRWIHQTQNLGWIYD